MNTHAVLSFSENQDLAAEVATAAAKVAATAQGEPALAVELDSRSGRGMGIPSLTVSADTSLRGRYERTADALLEVAKSEGSSVVLIGSTRFGRQVAGRFAVKAKQPILGDVKDLRLEAVEGKPSAMSLSGTRGAFAGKFSSRVRAPTPCVATVPAGAYEGIKPDGNTAGGAGSAAFSLGPLPPERVRHVETRPKQRNSVDLRSATVIVSAGRGFRKKEDLVLAEQLAEAMGGMLGASRPISSDLGWLGEERHIGLTGINVRPNLYLAVGISGQLQHVAGIKDSRIIAAINKDKQAPIFQVCDYGIVGDLYLVVPAMLKALAVRKGTQGK